MLVKFREQRKLSIILKKRGKRDTQNRQAKSLNIRAHRAALQKLVRSVLL